MDEDEFEDPETCSWCSAMVEDADLVELTDGARICPPCVDDVLPDNPHVRIAWGLDNNDPDDAYWSGTGELMSDDSYVAYVNNYGR